MNNPFKRKYPSFAHVVIDTECWALSPKAAVMSVGMVNFDLHTGKIRDQVQINVDFEDDITNMGGDRDEDTEAWWALPEREVALKASTNRQLPQPEALALVANWLDHYLPDLWSYPHKYCVWTMGSEFDPPILNQWSKRVLNHYENDSLLLRIHPKVKRDLLPRSSLADMRFLFKMWPGVVPKPAVVAHSAFLDAQSQYITIMKHRRLGLFNGMFNPLRRMP